MKRAQTLKTLLLIIQNILGYGELPSSFDKVGITSKPAKESIKKEKFNKQFDL